MSIVRKIKRAVRGEIAPKAVALEVLRRGQTSIKQRRDRTFIERLERQTPRLRPDFARMDAGELLEHFQQRSQPDFLPGFTTPQNPRSRLQRTLFPAEADELLHRAERVICDHSWPLLGLGEISFGKEIEWHRDLLSGVTWPLEYYKDIKLLRNDGSDVRIVWELNRLGHFITLARAYALTLDERFSADLFQQLKSWQAQNPPGRGVNWNCAMEVALRAMNLLGAFELIRRSDHLDQETLALWLQIFAQHGAFIRKNLEFSYIATSNHYLSDVVGLLWLGLMLPELQEAQSWREFGLREMLREMDKQVLADGADFESSTGYHRFVLELFLYSFVLCRANGIEIADTYWRKLRAMLEYVKAYLRPDGRAPLIGDSDSGQVFPICRRMADDHAYVLVVGASLFKETQLKTPGLPLSEELLWILGEQGVSDYQALPSNPSEGSRGFQDAGTFVLRDKDLYLLFNTSSSGARDRGSHGHNDALSIEVSACGCAFIVDPGSYVYTANLDERHQFRSTAYHSTLQIDGLEQNTIDKRVPFVIGDEAHPRLLHWEIGSELDQVTAEHHGYLRLPQAVKHRRTVTFNKRERFWLIEDRITCPSEQMVNVRFHFDSGIEPSLDADDIVRARENVTGAVLFVCSLSPSGKPRFESQFTSRDYGEKRRSVSVCWHVPRAAPNVAFQWAIVPVCATDDQLERLDLIAALREQSRSAKSTSASISA